MLAFWFPSTEERDMAFLLQTKQGVSYMISDMLRSRHAFATRLGGVSPTGPTASLNLAFGRGDPDCTVRENLDRFSAAVGFDARSVISVPQIHGNIVYPVDARHRGLGYDRSTDMAGDGYVTSDPTVTLGIKTADCTPVLLEARNGERVLAVAAVHAGWKGTVGDITGIGVRMLRERAEFLADGAPVTVYAAIGPCIHACCFTVQADCVAVVREKLGALAEPYIDEVKDGFTLDLPAVNRALLCRAGVLDDCIDTCPDCTACRTDRYYSHRAQQGVRGTMLSVICMA